jgi:hypothetical protein
VDEDFALNFSFSPLSLITLFNPNFFGNPGDGSYVIGGAYFETAAYIGVIPAVLALVGTIHYFRARRRRIAESTSISVPISAQRAYLIPFFALVTVVSLVFAFGKFTPIYVLLYRYAPTFNLFQAPARWLLLAVFSLAILAAFGASIWRPWPQTRRRARLLLIGSVSLVAAGIIVQVAAPSLNAIVLQMTRGLMILGVLLMATAMILITHPLNEQRWPRWAISVLLFIAVDLWWANSLSNPTVPASFYEKRAAATTARIFIPDPKNAALPEVAFENFLPLRDYRAAVEKQAAYRESLLPNLNLLDRQPSLNNFDPLRPEGLERYTALLNSLPNEDPRRIPLLNAGSTQLEPRSPAVQPRLWLVSAGARVDNIAEAERTISAEGWNPYQTAVIESPTEIDLPTAKQAGTATITQETPQDLTFAVDAPDGGILIVADTYYPGWEAQIGETPTRIYRANMAFRAVVVPPGAHIIRMSYRPRSFTLGVTISGVSLAICAVLLIVSLIGWRRSTPAGSTG